MSDPWLSIIGLGEDGPDALSPASRAALDAAEVVFGGPRHLALAGIRDRGRPWPVPFSVAPVLELRGTPVAVLASGDPFWFGAGGSLGAHLGPGEWRAFPVAGTFSLAAARLGWRLEDVACLGLHAAGPEVLHRHLEPGWRGIVLVRDAAAVTRFAGYLAGEGWGASRLWVLEALGGPRERVREARAADFALHDIASPVAIAIEAAGGVGLSRVPGRPDALFSSDGQITKSPVRALTLAALAPRSGELLWDLGAGSGSVAIEWALAGGRAVAVERRADRLAHLRANLARFGVADRVEAIGGDSAQVAPRLDLPAAIFVGGGLSRTLHDALPGRARLVVNAVTLETQALVTALAAETGGDLLKIDLARAEPLGKLHGWAAARTLVQWTREARK